MPALLTHVVFAEAYAAGRPELDLRRLVRGAVFPDIRHVAGLSRDQTHRSGVTLAQVNQETNAWEAGWLLHNYLDDAWNTYFMQYGLVFGRVADEAFWLALKLAEEILLWDSLGDRRRLARIFDGTPEPEELSEGVSREAVAAYDRFARWKVTHEFDPQPWSRKIADLGYTPEQAADLVVQIEKLLADSTWMGRLKALHEELLHARG
jgi:hypothetical protein